MSLARDTGARVVHVPLCWFAHESGILCTVEQKYVMLMYPPEMEPALGFLRLTRCVQSSEFRVAHEAHARVAVGFYTDGVSRGAGTATYPPELNRIMTRALAYPNRCASDEA